MSEKPHINAHINVDFFEDLTGDITNQAQKNIEPIGNRIKSLREEKKISLQDLSKLTGFDLNILSQIENNEISPPLGMIIKLSKALESALDRLVSGEGSKFYSITRKSERKVISRSTSQNKKKLYTYKSLAPEVKGRHMESLIVQLEENLELETSAHEGEEFIFVLDGLVLLKIGEEKFELEPGDSAYYLSTIPHVLASNKKEHATILAVIYSG